MMILTMRMTRNLTIGVWNETATTMVAYGDDDGNDDRDDVV